METAGQETDVLIVVELEWRESVKGSLDGMVVVRAKDVAKGFGEWRGFVVLVVKEMKQGMEMKEVVIEMVVAAEVAEVAQLVTVETTKQKWGVGGRDGTEKEEEEQDVMVW